MCSAHASAEERMDDLESRLAFQDEIINSLNDALVHQQNRIVALEKMLQVVSRRLSEFDESADDPTREPTREPPPPHY